MGSSICGEHTGIKGSMEGVQHPVSLPKPTEQV